VYLFLWERVADPQLCNTFPLCYGFQPRLTPGVRHQSWSHGYIQAIRSHC
jgi:hypothetical protein